MVLSLIAWPFTVGDHEDSGVWIEIDGVNERVRRAAQITVSVDQGVVNVLAFRGHPSMVGKTIPYSTISDRYADNTPYKKSVNYRDRMHDRYDDPSKISPLDLEDPSYVNFIHSELVNAQLTQAGTIPSKGK